MAARYSRRMPTEVFKASRWTKGNFLFPTTIAVSDTTVTRTKRSWFSKNEMSMHLSAVASVRIDTGVLWSDILIESTGGTDSITSHGHRKKDALRIKALIEAVQVKQLGAADGGPTRACPFCAETIKAAAVVCKHCKRDLPAPPK